MIFSKALDHWLVGARKYVLAMGLVLVACVSTFAQEEQLTSPKIEGKVIVGGAMFGEENLNHTVVGGAVRIYVTKRLSLEPEYLYMRRGENDQDHVGQMNVAWDFRDPSKRVIPYVIGGAGVLRNRGRVFGNDFVTRAPFVREIAFTTWTANAGGGLKIYLTKRLFVSPEFRIGREPAVRGTINVGYVFGGRR